MSIPKSNLSRMQDTKWHIGYVTKAPDDPRRDKRKCVYFIRDKKLCRLCADKCPGSSHCPRYSERAQMEEEFEPAVQKQRTITKNPGAIPFKDIKVGTPVFHKRYGRGEVVSLVTHKSSSQDVHTIKVRMGNRVEELRYPMCFEVGTLRRTKK